MVLTQHTIKVEDVGAYVSAGQGARSAVMSVRSRCADAADSHPWKPLLVALAVMHATARRQRLASRS